MNCQLSKDKIQSREYHAKSMAAYLDFNEKKEALSQKATLQI
tara:strand:- start:254 stop:379 length:126 start_codon:yes stop_codon:yes gene_type:complete